MKLVATAAFVVLCLSSDPLRAQLRENPVQTETPNIVVQWNNAALEGVRDSKLGPPMVARALAIVHTCMYDAWAPYDNRAIATLPVSRFRRPFKERTDLNRREAVSYAAYRALVDLFGIDEGSVFRPLMMQLGYDPDLTSTDPGTAAAVGNAACNAVLEFRHHDGANQLGDLSVAPVAYADYTGYGAVNPPSTVPVNPESVIDPNRWQPLEYRDATNTLVTQSFLGAQWGSVVPFALSSGAEFRDAISKNGPAQYGSPEYFDQAEELIRLSAGLTDEQKMIAEYWKDGPHSETPPGHWCLFAQFVSKRDRHNLGDDIKLFFALTNAEFDASIVAWDAKRAFDSIRPASAISYLFHSQQIRSWGGPGKGAVTMDGAGWIPYQPATFPTPPFPEYISGHSTFSAAGATILRLFSGSDFFGDSVSFPAGTSLVEPGITPATSVTLEWPTFSAAAHEAGFSRRLGGIHFRKADLAGRTVGAVVAADAWEKAKSLWSGLECRRRQ
jgi:hypothetical protein